MTQPGAVVFVIATVALALRWWIYQRTGSTLADFAISGFESWAKFWVAFVKALRAFQIKFRETAMELKDERA